MSEILMTRDENGKHTPLFQEKLQVRVLAGQPNRYNLALQAALCYNRARKLLCSKDAVTPLERVTSTLLRRLATMDSLSPRDFFQQEIPFVYDELTAKERKKAYNRAYYQSHYVEIRKQQKDYRDAHVDEIKAYGEQWRQSHREYAIEQERQRRRRKGESIRARNRSRYHANPAPVIAASRAWACSHIEQIRVTQRVYRNDHPELFRERHRQYRQTHPEQMRVMFKGIKARRRTRKTQAGGSYTVAEWQALKAQYDYTCLDCGKREPDIKLTADHVIPVTRNGHSFIGNIQPLCGPCNSKKHDKIIDFRVRWQK